MRVASTVRLSSRSDNSRLCLSGFCAGGCNWIVYQMSKRLLVIAAALAGLGSQPLRAAEPGYNSTIRPILSNNCFSCHGPDEADRKAKTRLDVAGEADLEEVLARITSTDPDEVMPPPESNKKLSPEQIGHLQAWIDSGAKYERHWAFVAPERSPVEGGANAIDQLEPATSPPADRLTLARRVYFDLIGLPPTPAEADAFARDPAPDAYEKLVDRLLASPRYGERWARRWLDLARYADTNGYEKDRDRSIWPYRDWVIRAINADMPFDQFTVEQLAGDMLPGASPQQRVATGFHRNTMLNEEGGIDPLEFRFHAMTDRVGTTGTTWLGLTTSCAQCHTHKYDPITHNDYFGMMAYLNNADEPDFIIPADGAGETREKNLAEADRLAAALPDRWPMPSPGHEFLPGVVKSVKTGGKARAQIQAESTILISGAKPPKDTYEVVIETPERLVTALRLEALVSADGKGPGRTEHGNFVLSEIEVVASPLGGSAAPQKVAFASAEADVEQPEFGVAGAIDGKAKGGWGIHDPKQPLNRDRMATFQFAEPVGFKEGTRLTVKLVQNLGGGHTIGRFRIKLGTPLAQPQEQAVPSLLAKDAFAAWLAKEREQALDWQALEPTEMSANFPYLIHEGDGVVFVGGDTSKHDIYHLKFAPREKATTSLRLEALPDDRLPDRGPGTTFYEGRKGDFYLTEFRVAGRKITSATESYAKNRFGNNPVSAKLATDGDIQTGWSVAGRVGERHVAVFVLDEPIPAGQAIELEMHFGRHYASSLGKFRVAATSAATAPEADERDPEIGRLLAKRSLTEAERARLFEAFLMQVPELAPHAKRIRDLRKPAGGTTTLVMKERPAAFPRETRRHHRGEFLSPREVVEPRLPDAIFPEGQAFPEDRLGFARWLVSDQNPLTARVVANRHWAALFGEGIVPTLDDFGMQGALPKNQALLDHLAVSLREEMGWSIKALHRQIVLSAAYRQKDRPRTRLEAEIIRDGALRIAGILNEKMFGAPVRPPQPAGVTEVAYGSPKWNASGGDERFRRSIYTYQKRTAPFAMFTTFDAGSGEACIARRDRSNTPLQALTLMNDPMFVEIAQNFGKKIAAFAGDDHEKIRSAFRHVLTREPTENELAKLEAFHARHPDWGALARVLLCLDEAITRP